MHPSMLHETGNIRSCTQHCCMVEPCAITLPYYAIHSYTAPAPTLVPTCCSQGLYNLERSVSQPPLQTPVAHVGDYFSVENTNDMVVEPTRLALFNGNRDNLGERERERKQISAISTSAVASKQQLLAVVVVVHGQQSLPPELLHLMESSEYFKIC
ncbi:hypothetical protein CK203_014963 [Vitis vinifera]|uniref:Uncharacterized protein n=1 Tax=Vitis vinifera TaxID=29760 RepID=A0A438JD11_VITVI|nr:hypothetical protein CK203_014963 [Vitis vinifera]